MHAEHQPTALQKRSRRRFFGLSLMVSTLLAVSLFGWTLYWLLQSPAAGEAVSFTIPSGATTSDIANILHEKGLIRNAAVFRYYLRAINEGDRFKAGDYTLQIGLDRREIIERLNGGRVATGESIRLTIPEGMTIRQMKERLHSKLGMDSDRFDAAAEAIVNRARTNPDASTYKWLAQIPQNSDLIHPLEGYLFPDTYEFSPDVTEQELIERLLEQTDTKLKQLPAGWEQRMADLGISLHQMLVIASIIEREVVVPEERPIVSGVLYNRLRKNMPMQSCATVQYLLPNQKKRLLYADLEIDSPYNTYKVKGFPPGPIANPGLAAMKAALYPENTDYLFFVTRNDGTSGHYFAKTYAEHNQNISRSRAFQN